MKNIDYFQNSSIFRILCFGFKQLRLLYFEEHFFSLNEKKFIAVHRSNRFQADVNVSWLLEPFLLHGTLWWRLVLDTFLYKRQRSANFSNDLAFGVCWICSHELSVGVFVFSSLRQVLWIEHRYTLDLEEEKKMFFRQRNFNRRSLARLRTHWKTLILKVYFLFN